MSTVLCSTPPATPTRTRKSAASPDPKRPAPTPTPTSLPAPTPKPNSNRLVLARPHGTSMHSPSPHPHPSVVSPLKIQKRPVGGPSSLSPQPRLGPSATSRDRDRERDNEATIPRRTSSSYKHVASNQLVSKSPFKQPSPSASTSSLPGPSTLTSTTPRKVSGEKRPRPLSMNSNASSGSGSDEGVGAGKGAGYKRHQTEARRVLEMREAVSKSPFRKASMDLAATAHVNTHPHAHTHSRSDPTPNPPPASNPNPNPKPLPPISIPTPIPPRNPSNPEDAPTPSPRSALVSRRMHGPRPSASHDSLSLGGSGKRSRRKTVTFNECCDVLEFDQASVEMGWEEAVGSGSDEEEEEEEGRYGVPEGSSRRKEDLIGDGVGDGEETDTEEEDEYDDVPPASADEPYYDIDIDMDMDDDREAPDGLDGFVDALLGREEEEGGKTPRSSRMRKPYEEDRGEDGPVHSNPARSSTSTSPEPEPMLRTYRTPSPRPLSPRRSSMSGSPQPQSQPQRLSSSPQPQVPPQRLSPSPQPQSQPQRLSPSPQPQRLSPSPQPQPQRLSPSPSPSPQPQSQRLSPSPQPQPQVQAQTQTQSQARSPLSRSVTPADLERERERERGESRERDRDRERGEDDIREQHRNGFGARRSPPLGFPRASSPREFAFGMGARLERKLPFDEEAGGDSNPPPNPRITIKQEEREEEMTISESLSLSSPTLDPASLCIGRSEVSLSSLTLNEREGRSSPVSPLPMPISVSPLMGPLGMRRGQQPGSAGSSPASTNGLLSLPPVLAVERTTSGGSTEGRRSPRITREEVQRRMAGRRSVESPLREGRGELPPEVRREGGGGGEEMWVKVTHTGDGSTEGESAGGSLSSVASKEGRDKGKGKEVVGMGEMGVGRIGMRREQNPTYDGIVTLEPEPAPIDPPRPTLHKRAATVEGLMPHELQRLGIIAEAEGGEEGRLPEMRSALDRLMDDVAEGGEGGGVRVSRADSGLGDEELMDGGEGERERERELTLPLRTMDRISLNMNMDEISLLSEGQFASPTSPGLGPGPQLFVRSPSPAGSLSRNGSDASSLTPSRRSSLYQKDAIRAREEMILEKRREARRRERELDGLEPTIKGGRPVRRRSRSTGDAEELLVVGRGAREDGMLNVPLERETGALEDTITRELMRRDGPSRTKYHVHEREGTIYASSSTTDAERVPGGNGAWRIVRRPSDMNEYAEQIREFKTHNLDRVRGKLFIQVVSVKNLNVPMPQQSTVFSCTLNNGVHYVSTPEMRLARDCRIQQEFELIEHSGLEFTLTLKVRRDPHIVAQFKALEPPPPTPTQLNPPPPQSKGGFRSFFTPKRSSAIIQQAVAPPPAPRIPDNLARYMKADGTLARAFIAYNDVAARCDTKMFEMMVPLIGQRLEVGLRTRPIPIGEIRLRMFRLPPLPGLAPELLPQSLAECMKGLQNIAWHKKTYYEGTLTQNGGDCTTWRRRVFRVIGSHLVAFSDITKKATTIIDLKKAVALEHDQEEQPDSREPMTGSTSARSARYSDDFDAFGVERSFRLIFSQDGQEKVITFFADTDSEKTEWLRVLKALVGCIPAKPLWAELVYQSSNGILHYPSSIPPSETSSVRTRLTASDDGHSLRR